MDKNKRKPRGHWTKENCHKEAKKYNSRTIFCRKSSGSYYSATKNGWLEEVCSHMKFLGNRFFRLVYVYEFSDKVVYVGLTYKIEKRDKAHKKTGPVYRHIKE